MYAHDSTGRRRSAEFSACEVSCNSHYGAALSGQAVRSRARRFHIAHFHSPPLPAAHAAAVTPSYHIASPRSAFDVICYCRFAILRHTAYYVTDYSYGR